MTLLLSLLLLACSGRTIQQGSSVDSFTRQLGERIPASMDWYNIPGISIALVQDGQLVWSGAYGYADLEHNRKMTVDAVCRAESISKSVTAWGVVKLAERGLISLDAPVQQYLDDFSLPLTKYHPNEVTIRRLLSNSAGMPLGSLGEEYPPNGQKPSLRQYLSKEVRLINKPGAIFEYSNPGFNLLELLVEKVTGRDFNDYMESEVLQPLGMHHSGYNWKEEWRSKVPVGYDLQGDPVAPYVYPYRASGGLFSTVEDIARFAMAGAGSSNNGEQQVLSRESIRRIQSPQIGTSGIFGFVADSYGFGHFMETLSGGKKAVWHGGQGHGWMTHFHLVPETGDGIVIFVNSQRSWPFMASVLNDWARWRGYGPVKFSRINHLVNGLWVFTGLIYLGSLWYGLTVIYGISSDNRRPLFSLRFHSQRRVIEAVLWIVIIAVLGWSASQDYLFISSVFPVGSALLGWGLVLLSVVLLFSILFPVSRESTDSSLKIGIT